MSSPNEDDSTPLLSPTSKTQQSQVTFTMSPAENDTSTPQAEVKEPPKSDSKPMRPIIAPPTPGPTRNIRADTDMSWGMPLGLGVRGANDENLIIFRRAVGINCSKGRMEGATLEEGRRNATGVYKSVIDAQTKKHTQHALMTALLYMLYLAQIIIGAALTGLGPSSAHFSLAITILGATNTIVAGVLALIKGSGQPQRLGKDQVGYRKIQDWIEETEALLAVGVIGRDRKEVGLLVEVAFKKYNAAKASEENNRPDMYVNQPMESLGNRNSSESDLTRRKEGAAK